MEDCLGKRCFFKLSANLIGAAMGWAIQAIMPRSLGPKAYGDFTFLTNFVTEVMGLSDRGTSIGFYITWSQKPQEISLVRFSLSVSGIVALEGCRISSS
jgi:hypothetical protein